MPNILRTLSVSTLLALAISSSWAQIPSLMPGKSPSSAMEIAEKKSASVVIDPNKEIADAQARMLESQNIITTLKGKLSQPRITEETRGELLKQFNRHQTLADKYAQQINYLKQLQVIDQKIVDAKQQRDTWIPPAGTPPWPIMEGDQIRNEMGMLEKRIAQLRSDLKTLSDQISTFGREKSDAEIRLRQLQDIIDKDSSNQNDANRKALDTARIELANKSAILSRTDIERRVREKQLALLEIELETKTKTWNYYDGRFELTPEVLATAKKDVRFLVDTNRAIELKALSKSESALDRLNKVETSYQASLAKGANPNQLKQARADLEIAQADQLIAQSEVNRLRQLIEMGSYAEQVWDARAELYAPSPPNAARILEMAGSVKAGLLRIKQARENLAQTLNSKEQEAFDLRESLLFSRNSLEQKVLNAKLKAANTESDSVRSLQAALDKFEQQLLLLQTELAAKENNKSAMERLTTIRDLLAKAVQNIWRYELFTVDDIVYADGKEIKTTRSVTIGKSIGAIVVLLIGYMLVSWLIRAAVVLAEKRMGLKTPTGIVIRRWLTVLATGTLIILSFNLVQIPLSVFAFLGGALAIGFGFGTQNLVKNLVSGVMLLVERPIRIGDFVEIEGIRGRVSSIGIRFSTIHSADGIDTLIPNSDLVEKKLTNWTFSNPDVRREIQIPVAYDTDSNQVENILQAVALKHPNVKENPGPMVLLESLGDSALIFTLCYWVRVDSGTNGKKIDSDLRRQILEQLKSAQISVPFSQRDVHLFSDDPIRVSIEH
jgi:small-conductance mechanosensitive channel